MLDIVLAQKEDLKAAHQLLVIRCQWFIENHIHGWNINTYPVQYNEQYLEEQMQSNKVYVAKEEGKIIGIMLLKSEDKEYWTDDVKAYYLHHFATDPHYQGIGKKMIEFAKEIAKQDGKNYLRLDCFESNAKLNGYYANLGFKSKGVGKIGNYEYRLWEVSLEKNIFYTIKTRGKESKWKN